MLRQHLLEVPARVAGGMGCHLLRSSRHDNLTALIATFWTEVDDQV